jgi:hypothetical protein
MIDQQLSFIITSFFICGLLSKSFSESLDHLVQYRHLAISQPASINNSKRSVNSRIWSSFWLLQGLIILGWSVINVGWQSGSVNDQLIYQSILYWIRTEHLQTNWSTLWRNNWLLYFWIPSKSLKFFFWQTYSNVFGNFSTTTSLKFVENGWVKSIIWKLNSICWYITYFVN